MFVLNTCISNSPGVVAHNPGWQHRRRKRGGQAPPNNLRGGANIPFGPPNNPPTCTGKTIPLNSILEFSIISYFKMRNVIIWHWFIKNLVGTWRRNDVDATSLRRIDVVTTSCACWEFGPPLAPQNSKPWPPPNSKPWPPQYSKPSYAYGQVYLQQTNISIISMRFQQGISNCKGIDLSPFVSHNTHWPVR